ncbi:hypothetical protein Droror1_Dr00024119 [Drosera rotundifolia]
MGRPDLWPSTSTRDDGRWLKVVRGVKVVVRESFDRRALARLGCVRLVVAGVCSLGDRDGVRRLVASCSGGRRKLGDGGVRRGGQS